MLIIYLKTNKSKHKYGNTWLQAPTSHFPGRRADECKECPSADNPELSSVPGHKGRWHDRVLWSRGDGGVRQAPSATVIINVGVISCRQMMSRVWTPSPHVTEHSLHSPGTHLFIGKWHTHKYAISFFYVVWYKFI